MWAVHHGQGERSSTKDAAPIERFDKHKLIACQDKYLNLSKEKWIQFP